MGHLHRFHTRGSDKEEEISWSTIMCDSVSACENTNCTEGKSAYPLVTRDDSEAVAHGGDTDMASEPRDRRLEIKNVNKQTFTMAARFAK
eukprot:superscaffoldBa00003613_g17321